jgi:hypothetical protein
MNFSVAIAGPFHSQFDTGDHNEFHALRRYNDSQMLLFCRVTFHGVFGIGPGIGFTLCVVDGPVIKYLVYFLCSNMTAIHPAPRMSRKN